MDLKNMTNEQIVTEYNNIQRAYERIVLSIAANVRDGVIDPIYDDTNWGSELNDISVEFNDKDNTVMVFSNDDYGDLQHFTITKDQFNG